MGGEEDGFLHLAGQAAQQEHHLHLGGEVQEGGGFVEEDDGRLLRQCLGNHHFLPLAVGERVQHAPLQIVDAHLLNGLIHCRLVLCGEAAPEARVGTAAHCHHLAHAHTFNIWSLCEHNTDACGPLLRRERIEGTAIQQQLAV